MKVIRKEPSPPPITTIVASGALKRVRVYTGMCCAETLDLAADVAHPCVEGVEGLREACQSGRTIYITISTEPPKG